MSSSDPDTTAGTTGAISATSAVTSANKKQRLPPPIESLLDQKDIWTDNIFPFLGVGHYAFVGGVNKQFNQLYKAYCHSVGVPCNTTSDRAAFFNVSCAKYWDLDDDRRETPFCDRLCKIIAKVGSVHVMQWAHKEGYPFDDWACFIAARNGHLDVLKYLHEKMSPKWDTHVPVCAAAAAGGHLDTLKYLHENGCPWDEEVLEAAARAGHLDILKYAHQHGCPWDTYGSACQTAACNGNLDALKYAHENGCPWSPRTCDVAAMHGQLDALKYAHENGLPMGRNCMF
ncbi:ankyrin containing protein (ISS) [Seminavis robusta]|uniref:Ankyrin containing protein (ISS) n=1 Tax=Seminavis robusta TaxID=568900 RepID=A0A9N8H331_9STRA|nr:ankyrin containing protein (ISS) [Seminavis robusta]|eukprot:Sro49_g028900.1 ankyrin containing protein (ISS) (286) ;mRNA; f:145789-146726